MRKWQNLRIDCCSTQPGTVMISEPNWGRRTNMPYLDSSVVLTLGHI
jgi:hypothetical protein